MLPRGPRCLARAVVTILALSIALALVVSGCTTQAPRTTTGTSAWPASSIITQPWGQRALDWLAAEQKAGAAGVPYLEPFLSPDVVVDHRCCLGRLVKGRDAWLAQQLQVFPDGIDEKADGAPYLDADGELLSVVQSVQGELWDLAVLRAYDGTGVRHIHYAVSLQMARSRTLDQTTYDAVDRLVRGYVSAWSGGGAGAIRQVYAATARVTDTVQGLDLRGLARVESAAGAVAPGASRVSVVRLPELYRTADGRGIDGGPAVFVTGDSPDDVAQVWLRVTVSAGAKGCTSENGVVLTLDGHGKISQERRLHSVASVRRCQGTPPRPAGWWDALPAPPKPVDDRVTGTLGAPDGPIEIRNGSPALQALVGWGLHRFQEAGLAVPRLSSVTFRTGVRQCADVAGLTASKSGGAAAVVLCFDDAQVCADSGARCGTFTLVARATVLHELAHAWLDQQATDAARTAFLRQVGVRAWSDPADAWQDRGSERAAETITWGLLDQEWRAVRIGDPPCEQLAAAFRLLTGTRPLRPPCPR